MPRFRHYREGQTVFSGIAADWGNGFILTGMGGPVRVLGANVTANYFELLGIHPILGRNFLAEEESKGDVVMVTENFWRNRLNGEPAVLGRSLTLNGVPTTIIGVLPKLPISWFGRETEVFANKPFEPASLSKEQLMRGVSFMRVTARLKRGVSMSQAQAAMLALSQSYKTQHPEAADNTAAPSLVSVAEDVTGNLRPAFLTLLAAVSAVLLIACSNVANLLLVRSTGRKREISLRLALGADRSGIVRLFVFESTLISLIAAVVGICLALWTLSIVPRLAGRNLPLETQVTLHWPVLLFTLGLSLLTGLLWAFIEPGKARRTDLVDGLKEGGRGAGGSPGQHRFRRGLVTAQVGFSVVLVARAALLISSFVRLSRQDAGFKAERVWAGGIRLSPAQYPDAAARSRFVERLQNELQSSPGVEAVAMTDAVPVSGPGSSARYHAQRPIPFRSTSDRSV